MLLKIFTKDDGPETRAAKEFGERVSNEGYEVEYLDLDDYVTDQTKELYDIHTSPAAIVVTEDGKLLEIWQGELPTESEVLNLMRL
jgi:deoxyribodipyrimidine photolyase-like uncharacterized protein